MNIESAKFNKDGSITALIDGVIYLVPNDMDNRHRVELAEWEGSRKGIITPYEEPAVVVTDTDVNTERDRRINAGCLFNGVLYDSDAAARENIAGAYSAALTYLASGASDADSNLRWNDPERDFEWIAHDNSTTPFTPAAMIAFGQSALSWKSRHIFAARALKDSGTIPTDYADDKYWPS